MKNSKKIVSLSLAATMLASSGAAFAMPSDTIVIGDQAFSVYALGNADLYDEIDAAIETAGDNIFYSLTEETDGFVKLSDENVKMTDEQKAALTNVAYTDKDGNTSTYEKFDDETPVAKWAIASASATNGKLTVVLSGTNETAPVASDFTATVKVDAADAAATTLTNFAWDAATKTATMDFPEVAGKDAEQTVVVAVTFDGVAKDATYKVPVTTDLAVESVSAINLKQVEVKFNQEVDKTTAELVGNVKIYDGTTSLATISSSLKEDKKTLVVYRTGTTTFEQNKEYKVVVENVKSADKVTTVTKTEKTVKPVDTTFPSVIDAKATTSKTIEVTFSEPVNLADAAKVWDEFYLNGTKLYATLSGTTSTNLTSNKVLLTLSSSMAKGDNTLLVKTGVKDFASLPIAEKSFTLNIQEDKTAPVMESAKVYKVDNGSGNSVIQVVFDEPVVDSDIQAGVTVKAAGGTNKTVTSVGNANGDKKTYELTLSGKLEAGALVETVVTYNNIKDLEGNTITTAKTLKFVAEDETVAPTITSYKVISGNKAELTFSEKLVNGTTMTGFKLYDKDNKVVSTVITSALKSGDTTETIYQLSFTGSTAFSGSYKLKIDNTNVITDNSLRANKLAAVEIPLVFGDVKAPTIASTAIVQQTGNTGSTAANTLDGLKMTIPYSEVMDSATATNLGNYMVSLNGTDYVFANTLAGASAVLSSDSKSVIITIPGTNKTQLDIGGVANITIANIKYKVLGVKDAALNLLHSDDLNSAKTVSVFVDNAATIVSITATGKRTLEVKSNVPFESIDPNGIRFVKAGGTDVAQNLMVSSVAFSTDKKTATLTLSADLGADTKFDVDETTSGVDVSALQLVTISKTAIVNNLEQYVANGTVSTSATNVFVPGTPDVRSNILDSVAPEYASIARGTTADKVKLTFNEDISGTALATDFEVKTSGGTILASDGSDYTVAAASGKTVELTIKKVMANELLTVALKDGTRLTDVLGNKVATFTNKTLATGQEITVAASAPAIDATASISQDTNNDGKVDRVVLTFDKTMNFTNLEKQDFAVTTNGGTANYTVTNATAQGTDKVVLDVTSDAVDTYGVKVAYAKAGAGGSNTNAITSSDAVALADTAGTVNIADKAAPVIKAMAMASDNTINTVAKATDKVTYTLTFSEAATAAVNTATDAANVANAVTTDVDASNATSDTIVFTVASGDNGAVTLNAADFTLTDAASNVTAYTDAAALNAKVTGSVTADTTATAAPTVAVTDVVGNGGALENTDKITLTFAEKVKITTGAVKGDKASDDTFVALSDPAATSADANGYATEWVITVGGTDTTNIGFNGAGSTAVEIQIDNTKITDVAGNAPAAALEVAMPESF